MLDAPGVGLAAPQIGVGLRVFTYDVDDVVRPPGQPGPALPHDEEQDGEEGCLSLPGLAFDCVRKQHVVAHGQNMYGDPVTVEGRDLLARCVQHETDHLDGVLFIDRLDPETRRPRCRRSARRSGRAQPPPVVKASPHPLFGRALTLPRGWSSPARRSPALPSCGRCSTARHEVVGRRHPPRRARRPRPALRPSPVRELAEAAGVAVLDAAARRARTASGSGCAALAPDCCPVVAYGALVPRAALDVPRHGWVNLHFSLLPAWRGAAPVQHALLAGDEVTGATTFLLEEGLDTGPVLGVLTEQVRAARHRRRPAGAAGRPPAPACSSPPSTAWRPAPARPSRSPPTASRSPPRSPSTTRGSTGPPPRCASTGWCAPAPRRRAPGRRCATAGSSSARSRRPTRCCRPACCGRPRRHRHAPRCASVGVRPEGKGEMAAADWLRGLRLEPGERLRMTGQHRPRRPKGGPRRAGSGRRRHRRSRRGCARRPPTRPGRRRTTCSPRSASATRTPTSCCPGCCASGGSTPATPRSPPSWRTARCARRGSSTRCCRPASTGRSTQVDPPVLDLLRLGAYQLLRTRVPPHAAVSATVDLARRVTTAGPAGFVNAVLRKVAAHDLDAWLAELAPRRRGRRARAAHQPPALGRLGVPRRPARRPRRGPRGAAPPTTRAPRCTSSPAGSTATSWSPSSGGAPGPWSPRAVRLAEGDPGDLAAVRDGRAGVQDEGSQLVALALAAAPLDGPDALWVDLCAGPGGKAALLDGLAAERGARLLALEVQPHRARLVRARRASARSSSPTAGSPPSPTARADRVLLDAPCSGPRRAAPAARGALAPPAGRPARASPGCRASCSTPRVRAAAPRRRARLRHLLARTSPRPSCPSRDVLRRHPDLEQLDARPLLPGVPDLGDGPAVQLWPHRHGTDAMFLALLRRRRLTPA